MGRKPSKKRDRPLTCAHCKTVVRPNAPMEGLIYEWNGKTEAICSECGMKVISLFKQMHQRWG